MAYTEGEKVAWDWGNGSGTGTVRQVYTRKVTLKIKGNDVTRNAGDDDPAYRIEQDDGDEVLKGHDELRKVA